MQESNQLFYRQIVKNGYKTTKNSEKLGTAGQNKKSPSTSINKRKGQMVY